MKSYVAGIGLLWCSCQCTQARASSVLDIPFQAGQIHTWNGSCRESPRGGIIPLGAAESCSIDLPIPIESGRTIKQISVYYGTNHVGPTLLWAELRYMDLRAVSAAPYVNLETSLYFTTLIDVPPGEVAYGNLMHQASYPIVSYPDAFAVDTSKAYFVRVRLGIGSETEFFGLKVLYE